VAVSDEKKTETVRDRLLGMVSVSRS